jgi:hypothetical protein
MILDPRIMDHGQYSPPKPDPRSPKRADAAQDVKRSRENPAGVNSGGVILIQDASCVRPVRYLCRAGYTPTGCYMKRGASTSVIVLSSFTSTCNEGPAVSLKGSPTVSPTTAAL